MVKPHKHRIKLQSQPIRKSAPIQKKLPREKKAVAMQKQKLPAVKQKKALAAVQKMPKKPLLPLLLLKRSNHPTKLS